VTNLAFSPDGKTMATASNDRFVRLCDVQTGALENHGCHQQNVYSVAFASSDGTKVVSGGGKGEMWWWDRTTKKGTPVSGHRDDATICCLKASPDSRRLISGTVWGTKTEAIIWDISGGAPAASGEPVEAGSVVSSISFSPDSERFALGLIQPTVCIRRLSDGAEERILVGEGPWMSGAAFSPKGEHLVAAGASGELRIYRNWRAPNGDRDVTVFRTTDEFRRVEFFPDGKAFVTASMDGDIRVWRLEEPVRRNRPPQ
jgi:WD40 repeat protein